METKNIKFFIIFAFIFVLGFGCQKSESGVVKSNFKEDAMDDIENISYSVLNRLEPISIFFKEKIENIDNIEKACKLTPSVKGKWELLDGKHLKFTPAEAYDFKKELVLNLDVGLLTENKAKTKGLTTTFTITSPEFSVVGCNLIPEQKSDAIFSFEATGISDIPMDIEIVKSMLSAELDNSGKKTDMKIRVTQGSEPNKFKIKIDSIKRKEKFQELLVSWDLNKMGLNKKDSKSFSVAPRALFQVTSIRQENNSEICVNFSDSIDVEQDLRGLVKVTSNHNFTYRWTVDDFKLKIFIQNMEWPEDTKLSIFKGIKSKKGSTLNKEASFAVSVAWEKPTVMFTKQGNIVPAQDNVSVLVSTKNIKGVMLEAFQIYDKNMLQHFQVNNLNDGGELKRVGEPVWRQRFDFEWTSSMKNSWKTHSLDITKLLEKFPGGMFELSLSFTKKDSIYQAPSNSKDFSFLPFPRDITEFDIFKSIEEDYWDNFSVDNYSKYDFWAMRENPNHPAYYLPSYNSKCIAKKLVLVSNLGASVKKDREDNLYIAVADLISAKPVSGATVSLFSYAQKKLESSKTDSTGLVMMPNKNDAYFVQVEKGDDINWVLLNSNTLTTSHFEVDGQYSKKGVKGYIYGERGVWRPGDKIHLSFILQDLEKTLPKEIPVNFTLEDPMGKKTEHKVLTSSVDGFYRVDTKTNSDDKTGSWTARFTVGGRTYSKAIKVESIVPNRLFVNLKSNEKYLSAGSNLIDLSSEWLHGAKASGLKAEISARYILNRNPFEKYKNYNFINSEISVQSNFDKVWEGNLNEDGFATVDLSLSGGNKSPGKLTAIFETRVYEPSGAYSIETKSFDFSPYKKYVGMQIPQSDDQYRNMLYTNKNQTLNFIVVDSVGNLVKDQTNLKVDLYKLSWHWWWEVEEDQAKYSTSRNANKIKSWDVLAKNGKANLNMEIADESWGRYLFVVSDKTGKHSSAQVVYFDWEGWASRKVSKESSSSMLLLSTDKDKYYTNETAIINFPSYEGAKALVTVEKNGKVLKQEWIESKGTLTSYNLDLDKNMAPNVYVHISLIQEHNQTKNSLPIRLYGITPVMVENKETRLLPEIKTANSFEPNSKAEFTISEKNGKPMTYTVAVVDEGLLGLTAFNTKDPWNTFYKKESSQLDSWDIYNYVMDAYAGQISSLLKVGGGGFINRKGGKNAERFKPVVFYFGPYELKANEKKKIEFDMPQYVGAVRIMAVAGKNGAYGICEETVKVKSDLIVMPTLPRTMGNEEKITIPVTAFNGTNKEVYGTVKLTATGAVNFRDSKKITIPANSDKTVFFSVNTEKEGVTKFNSQLSATGISKKAISDVEIAVLSRGTPYTTTESFTVTAGALENKTITLKGEKGTKKLSIEISQMPSLGLEKRLSYLLGYPYGCVEQITSKAFPQLYLPEIMTLDKTEIEKTKENINSVLARYTNYQVQSGGFAYWPNSSNENEWATNYAGHFMVEAKKMGYEVNESVYDAWLANQKEKARNWASSYTDSIENQAYRLFTLALANEAEIGAMNRLKNMEKSLNDISLSFLANSYALAGHHKTAKKLLARAKEPTSSYRYTGRNFSSTLRDSAVILNAYTITGENIKATKIVEKLAKISSADEWLSTQETAWILLSVAPYYKFDKSKKIQYQIQTVENTIKDSLVNSARLYNIAVDDNASKKITIKNKGDAPFFVSITSSGRLKPGEEVKTDSNMKLIVKYLTEEGTAIEATDLKLGQLFKMRVSVKNITNSFVDNIVLSLPIPTGWEIRNLRIGENEDENEDSSNALYDYQDIKDTHIYTHFNLKEKETKTFEFSGTVTYSGVYHIPAIWAEAMYDNEYFAISR